MAQRQGNDDGKKEPVLLGSIEGITELEDRVEVTVNLQNPSDRPLHYVSDIRAMTVDPATGGVEVRLSEAGLEIPPGGFFVQPRVRVIDPGAQAALTVALPRTILKLGSAPAPAGEGSFEELPIAGAPSIRVDIGWSETPYYEDRRPKAKDANPVAAWEKTQLRVETEARPQRS